MQGDTRRQGNSGSQHQPRREIRKTDKSRPEGKSGRKNSLETKQQWQPRAAQKGNHEGNSWETKQQRQPRGDEKGNHEGRPAGRQGNSGSQEQTRREIGGNRETKQQWQPRAAQKENQEDKATASSPEGKS